MSWSCRTRLGRCLAHPQLPCPALLDSFSARHLVGTLRHWRVLRKKSIQRLRGCLAYFQPGRHAPTRGSSGAATERWPAPGCEKAARYKCRNGSAASIRRSIGTDGNWRDPVAPCFSAGDAPVAVVVVLTERAAAACRRWLALGAQCRPWSHCHRPRRQSRPHHHRAYRGRLDGRGAPGQSHARGPRRT